MHELRKRVDIMTLPEYALGQLVEALRYNPEGRDFDSR
jgi:hypothetical protein